MIPSGDDQLGVGQGCAHNLERLNHQLEPFVSSPFAEGQYAVLWVAAPGKVRILGSARQNAMGSNVDIVVAILFMQDLPIPRHEHRNRIREQEHSGGNSAGRAVGARVSNPCILQIDGIHQVMQGDMGVAAAQTRQQRSKQTQEGIQRISAKRTEEQIEPDHIGFQFSDGAEKSKRTRGVVEGPATLHREAIQFGRSRGNLIGKNRKAEERITTQLLGNMKAILAQSSLAGREGSYQTDFHYSPASLSLLF
jgi:hypothetical protein